MKKSRTAILLSLLLLAAQAGLYTFQPATAATPVLAQQAPLFSPGKQLPQGEIEYGGAYEYISFHNNQGWQKTPGCPAYYEKKVADAAAFYPVNTCTYVELYKNSHLSHNYPSHNFW